MATPVLRFVHFSDTHIHDDPAYQISSCRHHPLVGAMRLVEELQRLPFQPDFALHTGDVAFDPMPSVYQKAQEVFQEVACPLYFLAGNHDDSRAVRRLLQALAPAGTLQWAPHSGTEGEFLDYEFQVNGFRIICLDSSCYAEHEADHLPANGISVQKHVHGHVSQEQLAWLRESCQVQEEGPLIVAIHHNVLPMENQVPSGQEDWLNETMRVDNGEDLHEVLRLAGTRLRGVFSGHVHQDLDMHRDGISYMACRSTWYQLHAWPYVAGLQAVAREEEPGFNIVTVTPRQTVVRRHRFTVR